MPLYALKSGLPERDSTDDEPRYAQFKEHDTGRNADALQREADRLNNGMDVPVPGRRFHFVEPVVTDLADDAHDDLVDDDTPERPDDGSDSCAD